jgi:hypothetical protein
MLAAWMLLLAPARRACGDDQGPSREYQVKAAMICNFVQFVDWPREAFASDSAPLVIGVVGANPFGNVLEQLTAGKTLAGHPVAVRYFSDSADVHECHVLFVPASEESSLSQILKRVDHLPILSIGETDSFPWHGGIIRFYAEDNKVRFEISPDAADQAHLRISSKLMKLARIFKR